MTPVLEPKFSGAFTIKAEVMSGFDCKCIDALTPQTNRPTI